MRLLELTAKNFLSLKEINITLDNQGLTLIKGINKDNPIVENNGSGKSSIIESIVYALYGRTVRGLTGDSIIHNKAKKDTMVSLTIESDTKDIYKIIRYRKDSEYKNKFFLYLNDADITPKSEKDFTEEISNILQMDYSTFTASILYTAQSFKFTSASDSEIKKSFDKMLNLDVLSKAHDEVKEEIKNIKNDTLNLKEKEKFTQVYLDECDSSIKEYTDQIKQLEQLLKDDEELKEKTIAEETKVCKEINSKIKVLEEKHSDVEVTLNKWKAKDNRNSEPSEVTSELNDKLKDNKEDTQTIKEKKENYENKLNKCNHLLDNLDIDKERAEKLLKEKIKAKEDILNKDNICPVCKQLLEEHQIQEAIDNSQKEIDNQKSKLKEIEDDYITYSDKKDKFKSKLEKCKSILEELEEEKLEIEGLLERDRKDRENKNKEVLENIQVYSEKLHEVKLELMTQKKDLEVSKKKITMAENIDNQLIQRRSSIDTFTKRVEEAKKQRKAHKDTLDNIQKTLENYTSELECLEFWQKAYSNAGIKSLILEDITPFLNKRVNHYLNKISDGSLEVNFSTQMRLKSGEVKDKFIVEVINKFGGENYQANSTGEKKRVDICVNLAIQDLVASRSNSKINICFFDEVFDGLDETGINSTIELLQEISKDRSSVFVISHNPYLSSMFSNTITVIKENGYSTLL